MKMAEVKNLQNALFQRQMQVYRGKGWYVAVVANTNFTVKSYDMATLKLKSDEYSAKDFIVFKQMGENDKASNGKPLYGHNHLFDGPHDTKKDAQAWLAINGPFFILAIAEEPLVFDAIDNRTGYYPLRAWAEGWKAQEQVRARCK